MTIRRGFLAATLCILFAAAVLYAQDTMWPGGNYDPDVPTPESVLGYKIGRQHTPVHLIEKFILAMEKASDRVVVREIGKTHQGRSQYLVIISSPANIARIDEIRAQTRKLADPKLGADELEAIVASLPATVMVNCGVHGNEGTAHESGLRTIYQLAAGTDEKTLAVLDNIVTLVNPVLNPDGHDRYVHFINGYLVDQENPNTDSMEHSEPWPGGRGNAYYFDLNRDWFLLTQPESYYRMIEYQRWLPQVAPDLHEMGTDSTFFFPPPLKPINKLISGLTIKWWEILGQAHAAAFDNYGWTYYTRESFDEFYSGYGGSMPDMFGAIAMTFEQGSPRGRVSKRRDGTLIDLTQGTWHHFTATMATLTTVAERKDERLRDFHEFFVEVDTRGVDGKIREFYIPPADPTRFKKLLDRLQLVGAEVHIAREPFTVKGAYNYFTKETKDAQLPEGTAIVNVRQFAGAAVMTMLEPESLIDEDFLKEELAKIRRGEESNIYDVTGWSMPLTYGINAYWAGTAASVAKDLVPAEGWSPADRGPIPQARVAYLIPPDSNANITLVSRLLAEKYRVRVNTKKFVLGGKTYPPGTAVLYVVRNPESLHERINTLAVETGGYADATNTGYTGDGGIDLGSNDVPVVKNPSILLAAERPTSSTSFGEIRFLLENVYKVPYTAVAASRIGSLDLHKYNVIILPDAWSFGPYSYKAMFGKGGVENIKRWVHEGGVLICIGGAVDFAVDEEVQLSAAPKYTQKRKMPGEAPDQYQEQQPPAEEEKEKPGPPAKEKEKKFEVEELLFIPGAIVKAELDDRSFLTWGYSGDFIPVKVHSSNLFVPITDDQGLVAARYGKKEELRYSGVIWDTMLDLLPGKAYAWHEGAGRGMVICFAEEITFRASYDGLDRMFFNAIIFSLSQVR